MPITGSSVCLQPLLSVMMLKTMIGMFRNIFKEAPTVMFIKTIRTILDKINSGI
jgi:hypothetical protein